MNTSVKTQSHSLIFALKYETHAELSACSNQH